MKVWQAGSHLSDERGAEVRDWSWRRTRRRLGVLARLTLPYRGRTALALATLLAFTLVALAPPYLSKLAIDEGIKARDLDRLSLIVGLFVLTAIASLALSAANTYLTGRVGERTACGIYEWRPNPCRELEPGSHGCEKARARRGLPPLEASIA